MRLQLQRLRLRLNRFKVWWMLQTVMPNTALMNVLAAEFVTRILASVSADPVCPNPVDHTAPESPVAPNIVSLLIK